MLSSAPKCSRLLSAGAFLILMYRLQGYFKMQRRERRRSRLLNPLPPCREDLAVAQESRAVGSVRGRRPHRDRRSPAPAGRGRPPGQAREPESPRPSPPPPRTPPAHSHPRPARGAGAARIGLPGLGALPPSAGQEHPASLGCPRPGAPAPRRCPRRRLAPRRKARPKACSSWPAAGGLAGSSEACSKAGWPGRDHPAKGSASPAPATEVSSWTTSIWCSGCAGAPPATELPKQNLAGRRPAARGLEASEHCFVCRCSGHTRSRDSVPVGPETRGQPCPTELPAAAETRGDHRLWPLSPEVNRALQLRN